MRRVTSFGWRAVVGIGLVSSAWALKAADGPPSVGQENCDAIAWMAGACGTETQYQPWLREILEKGDTRRPASAFPPEPEGLVIAGANRKVSGNFTFPLSETAVSVSAANPLRIAIGANSVEQLRQVMFVSKDGGRTFRRTLLPTTVQQTFTQGDPTVAWTSDGTLWAGAIEGVPGSPPMLKGQSFRSVDQGATWTYAGAFSGAERLADRPTFWVDPSTDSRFRDSLYVTWHNGPVYVTRRPKGAAGWSAPVRISPPDTQGFGGDLKTDSLGRIYAFWPDAMRKKIFVATSTDGGAHFSAPTAVAPVAKPLFDLAVAAAGRSPTLYVTAAVVRIGTVRRAFVAWYDAAAAPDSGARIWFSASSDGGRTWSAARQVRPSTVMVDQFHPALAVDATSGRLTLAYTDTSADPAGLKTRRVLVASNDFGVTWSAPVALSTAASDILAAPQQIYGDYQSVFALGPRLWAVWTDRRTTAASSVWMAEVRVTATGIRRVPIDGPAVESAPEPEAESKAQVEPEAESRALVEPKAEPSREEDAEPDLSPAIAPPPIVRVSPDRTPVPPGAQPETQAEPQVAVSPANPKILAAAWQDGRLATFGAAAIGWSFSRDEGKTWTRGLLPRLTSVTHGPFELATDPWVAFDASGRAYVSALVRRAGTVPTTGIVVLSTANFGTNWRGPVVVHETEQLDDKVSIAVDNVAASPLRGAIYAGWSIQARPVVARSLDQGRTWSAPVELPGENGFDIGVVLASSSGGRLHAVWRQAGGSIEGSALRTAFSLDGGATWSPATTIASVVSPGVLGVRTGDGLPSLAVAGDRLFVVWHDGRFAPDETVHVAFSSSSDRGATWSAPRRISGGPLAAASFLPAVATDAHNLVGVTFLSVRNDPAKAFLADLFFVASADGGRTFGAPRRLTSRSFDLRAAAMSAGQVFVGDYFGLAAGTKFYALFIAPWFRSVRDPQRFQPDVLAATFAGR